LAFFDQLINLWDLWSIVAWLAPATVIAIVPTVSAAIAAAVVTARIAAAPPGAACIASHFRVIP
jgi:hypothetical protein